MQCASVHVTQIATRSTTTIWLVVNSLPSIELLNQLLRVARLFVEYITKLPIACSTVTDEVMSFWVKDNL